MTGEREQHRRQRRIDEIEIGVGIGGIKIAAVEDLLPGPEPERIVLGLSAAENLRTEHVGGQHQAAGEEENIERRSQRRISQLTSLSKGSQEITGQAGSAAPYRRPA